MCCKDNGMSDYIYKQIKNYILNLLREHNFDPDYKLPSDNQLALKFNVSRVSVRKAFDELEKGNVIVRLKGKGTFPKEKSKIVEKPTITLILPSSESSFANAIIRGVSSYCNSHNLGLTITLSFCSVEAEKQCFINALNSNSQGIIIMPFAYDYKKQQTILSIAKKIPTVLIDRNIKDFDAPYISSNHYEIAYSATKFLCEKKHTNILFVSSTTPLSSTVERESGYRAALKDYNLDDREFIFVPYYNYPETLDKAYIEYLTKHNVTAIISSSGDMALRLSSIMKQLGKQFSIDYDLVLIDNESYYFESILGQKIPTIIQDGEKIGSTAAQIIHKLIKKENNVEQTTYIPIRFDY